MINRVLIRIRVVQVVYASLQNEEVDIKKAENELFYSLEKSYDLYFFLFALMTEITNIYQNRLKQRQNRYLPSEEGKNPNLKFVNNRLVELIANSESFRTKVDNMDYSWEDHEIYTKSLLDKILSSEYYKEYMLCEEDNFQLDKEIWKKIFKQIICVDEALNDLLEDLSLYWNDDVEIVESFVLKTIKKMTPETPQTELFLPMFKDEEDKLFASQLLNSTLNNLEELQVIIDKHTQNWDSERVALMDRVIMLIATSELQAFPSIPISVTLNEYIDMVKAYSTNKSAGFINGVLDAVVQELKKENKLNKA